MYPIYPITQASHLGIYSRYSIFCYEDTCSSMFIAAPYTITRNSLNVHQLMKNNKNVSHLYNYILLTY